MSACRLLQQQRVGLLQVLCSSGTAEVLESVLDRLLAWDVLQWEDCQSLRPPNRPLSTSARELLDVVASKGEEACGALLVALDQVLPGAQKGSLSLGVGGGGPLLADRPGPSTDSQMLRSERPRLVARLRPCIGAALRALVQSGSLTTYDCDEVQLPINTPAQQASAATPRPNCTPSPRGSNPLQSASLSEFLDWVKFRLTDPKLEFVYCFLNEVALLRI